jgi:hypothetical protein
LLLTLSCLGANKVVIFDPNWSEDVVSSLVSVVHELVLQILRTICKRWTGMRGPHVSFRAFRFGQTRDVTVYRLLGAGSVEELIYARQIYKQQQMAIGYEASIQTRSAVTVVMIYKA